MVKRAAGAALGLMAAKDWIVHKNVIEIHGYFPETVAKTIKFFNIILQWSNSHQLKPIYPENLIIVAISFMTTMTKKIVQGESNAAILLKKYPHIGYQKSWFFYGKLNGIVEF